MVGRTGFSRRRLMAGLAADASVSDETWQAAAAKNFKGKIIVARDLMVI